MDPNWIGYKKDIDANITMQWGSYYFATIGAFLSSQVDEIYFKTALARLPFAIIGLIGLLIFALAFKNVFPNNILYQKFLITFIIIELLSVILFLHLREARYYSLVIFITSCFLYTFINYFILNKYSFKKYLTLMTLVLFTAYHINFIDFAACCISLSLYEMGNRISQLFSTNGSSLLSTFLEQFKMAVKNLLPVLICFALVAPFVFFTKCLVQLQRPQNIMELLRPDTPRT